MREVNYLMCLPNNKSNFDTKLKEITLYILFWLGFRIASPEFRDKMGMGGFFIYVRLQYMGIVTQIIFLQATVL